MRCVPEQKNARGIRLIIAALLIGGGSPAAEQG